MPLSASLTNAPARSRFSGWVRVAIELNAAAQLTRTTRGSFIATNQTQPVRRVEPRAALLRRAAPRHDSVHENDFLFFDHVAATAAEARARTHAHAADARSHGQAGVIE